MVEGKKPIRVWIELCEKHRILGFIPLDEPVSCCRVAGCGGDSRLYALLRER